MYTTLQNKTIELSNKLFNQDYGMGNFFYQALLIRDEDKFQIELQGAYIHEEKESIHCVRQLKWFIGYITNENIENVFRMISHMKQGDSALIRFDLDFVDCKIIKTEDDFNDLKELLQGEM